MLRNIDANLVAALEKGVIPFAAHEDEFAPIIEAARNKDIVLLGEATHGTKEFYAIRASITRRLIQECGFDAVAVEADWPDAYAVNRHVSLFLPSSSDAALKSFTRFPTWMWRNTEVRNFIEWLHAYNFEFRRPTPEKPACRPAGFYGLDIYSMRSSIEAVTAYLDKADPAAARRARDRYACLDHFLDDPQSYGYAAEYGLAESCEKKIVSQLMDLQLKRHDMMLRDGFIAEDEFFSAVQNARLVQSAEQYYRSMFRGRPNSWNLRDQHMFQTLKDLSAHLGKRLKRAAKIVVWAHNSHLGNAAATEMSRRGEFNIGQLVRSAYGERALSVGFSTALGTVTAASDWDEPAESIRVNAPFPGSYEDIFHKLSHKRFMLDLRREGQAADLLTEPRLQRAIGVVYRPMTERHSHYFHACLPQQFDFMIHVDETNAVKPLEAFVLARPGELDDTYPYGL